MSIFKRNKTGGFFDVIRCDEHDYLIWKWHPSGVELGKGKRETAIRTNSVLRVKDGEVAVFVYKQKDGTMQDYIVGPFDQTIKTGNFPVLSSFVGLLYEGDTPFQAEVFFINLARVIQVKFGVPYFNVCDPRFLDFPIPVAVRGTVNFKIEDYKSFIKFHRLDNFELSTLQSQIRDTINRQVKDVVSNAPSKHNIPVINLETKTQVINVLIEENLKIRLNELYGIEVTSIDIGAIEIDKQCNEYIELKRVTKDVVLAKTNIDLQNYEETLRIQREEGQYAQHKATQQQNLAAYQVERQAEVGIAGAQALGQMGSNGAGDINLGGNAGFNPMTMMAGMAVGSAVGQNIAGTMNNSINGVNQPIMPSIPKELYYVAVNNQPTGPYDLTQIQSKIVLGEINQGTLLWKQGMPEWKSLGEIGELRGLITPAVNK